MKGIAIVLQSLLLLAGPAFAADRTYLEVSPDGSDDLTALLGELEVSLASGLPVSTDPVVVVLHGSEAVSFTASGYHANRELVDRAARLDAYRLIDVRICETWMTDNGIERSEIPAFVEPVPYAPEEIERLQAEGYVPRDSVSL